MNEGSKSNEIDPDSLADRLLRLSDPELPHPSVGEIKFSGLPITGFIMGSALLLTLFVGRVISILAFFVLPFMYALVLSVAWLIVTLYLDERPVRGAGLIFANPPSAQQNRIISSLAPFLAYKPPWWCLDNHFTTILPVVLFRPNPRISIRQRFSGDDDAPLWLDWRIPSNRIKGIILAAPGLNGSSKGGYIVDLMERMAEVGIAVAVLNGRGAGRTSVVSIESSFHMGRPSDLMHAIEAIERVVANVPVYIVGYSAGGIRSLNFASVYGESLEGRVKGILSFGGIVKNDRTTSCKLSRLAYQPVIVHAFASTMYSKFVPHLKGDTEEHHVHRMFHRTYYTSFVEYDRNVTSKIHNLTLEQYHDHIFANHGNKWRNIAVPTLLVNACDDPVLHIDDAVVPEIALNNSFVTYLVTEKGGHIGWPMGSSQSEHGYKWISDVVLAYINAIKE